MTALEHALAELAAEEAKALADEIDHEIDYVMCEITRPVHIDPEMQRAFDALAKRAA